MGEGREEVGDARGPVCSAVLRDLPKLRGITGYTTSTLSPHHTGGGKARVEDGKEEEHIWGRGGRRWGTPGGLSVKLF